MSLRGKIRKLAVIVAVAGAVVSVPTAAMAGGHAPQESSSQKLESGSAGVGLFGPHATWLNFAEHSESDCDC
ncbi:MULTISPECIES: hypothetical protein [Streptomyces]|uniref:hypothetical protein n=1 Tax=Streptomyces TaxID=1883 RepID=UPI0004AA69C1|nr:MULTISPECIES: hypothetical protein [Streptomyces]